jgi:hypothetical protein
MYSPEKKRRILNNPFIHKTWTIVYLQLLLFTFLPQSGACGYGRALLFRSVQHIVRHYRPSIYTTYKVMKVTHTQLKSRRFIRYCLLPPVNCVTGNQYWLMEGGALWALRTHVVSWVHDAPNTYSDFTHVKWVTYHGAQSPEVAERREMPKDTNDRFEYTE